MRKTVIVLLCVGLGVAACSGSERRTPKGAKGLPIISQPMLRDRSERRGMLGRLNPLNAVSLRNTPSRGVREGVASSKLCGVNGIEGTAIAPITSNVAGCGVAKPVRVTHVDGVRLSQAAAMDCKTATALHTWVTRAAKPAIGRSGGGIASLRVPAHYVCRTRNHRPGARISEHGRGRAIDISAILLADGTEISVLRDWRGSKYSTALQQMHRNACGIFGTTLGPGSDGMHEDHFHYDTAKHRGGPYCR